MVGFNFLHTARRVNLHAESIGEHKICKFAASIHATFHAAAGLCRPVLKLTR